MPLSEEEEKRLKVLEETNKKLMDSLTALTTSQKKLGESLETVSDSIIGISERLEAKKDDVPKQGADKVTQRDLEQMNRGQFMEHIMGQIEKALESKLQPVAESIEKETTTRKQRDVAAQVSDCSKAHKDFWDWKDEIGKLAIAHKSLPVDDLYLMARAKDPGKAKELDEKYAPAKPESKEETGFGGLFPSGAALSSEELKKELTTDQAAELAWDKTMKGVHLPSE